MLKLKKGDNVIILSGKDKGKKGKVIRVLFDDKQKIIVEGLNRVIKHVKPKRQGEKGQKVSVSVPFPASRAQLICPNCGKSIRVGFNILEEKKKRFCRKCKTIF